MMTVRPPSHLDDELLSAHLDGAVEATEAERLAHLDVCPVCRERLDELAGVREAVSAPTPADELPAGTRESAVAAALEAWARGRAAGWDVADSPRSPAGEGAAARAERSWATRTLPLLAAAVTGILLAAAVAGVALGGDRDGEVASERTEVGSQVGVGSAADDAEAEDRLTALLERSEPQAAVSAGSGPPTVPLADLGTQGDLDGVAASARRALSSPPATRAGPGELSCEVSARRDGGDGLGHLLLAGGVRYRGEAATALVFAVPDGGRRVVVTASAGCRLLGAAPL